MQLLDAARLGSHASPAVASAEPSGGPVLAEPSLIRWPPRYSVT